MWRRAPGIIDGLRRARHIGGMVSSRRQRPSMKNHRRRRKRRRHDCALRRARHLPFTWRGEGSQARNAGEQRNNVLKSFFEMAASRGAVGGQLSPGQC